MKSFLRPLLYFCILATNQAFADEAGVSTTCDGTCTPSNAGTTPIRVDFDACVTDPDAAALQQQWTKYRDQMHTKISVNANTLADRARLSQKTDDPTDTRMLQFIDSMHNLQGLSQLLDQIEGLKEVQPMLKNPHFMQILHSDDMLQKIQKGTFLSDINDSDLNSLKNDSNFQQAIQSLTSEMQKPEVLAAVATLHNTNLSLVNPVDRQSYKGLESFFNTHGSTAEAVQAWKTNSPLVKNVALPKGLSGSFATAYSAVVQSEMERDLRDHWMTLADARKLNPKITQAEVDSINAAEPPVSKNAYDELVRKKYMAEGPTTADLDGAKISITPDQSAAISGVARTLWGEVRGCAAAGLPQFEAVGRIIGDRAADVCRDIKSKLDNREAVLKATEQNWEDYRHGAPLNDSAKQTVYRGYGEFGRSDLDLDTANQMNCGSQVISRDLQFSVWNPYTKTPYSYHFSSPNLPSFNYSINGPLRDGDEQALNNILCPQTKLKRTGELDPLWTKALKVATEIVMKPESLAQKYKWSSNDPEILFYTHAAPLPFAKPISVESITDDTGKMRALRGQGHGACDQFELFTPRAEGGY